MRYFEKISGAQANLYKDLKPFATKILNARGKKDVKVIEQLVETLDGKYKGIDLNDTKVLKSFGDSVKSKKLSKLVYGAVKNL